MSKLEDILDEIHMANPGGELKAQREAEQAIKDLMLKIVDTAYSEKHEDSPHATEMWHEICNEVKQL